MGVALHAVPPAGVGHLPLKLCAPATCPALFATMGAPAATYAVLAHFFVLEQPERDRIKSVISWPARFWRSP